MNFGERNTGFHVQTPAEYLLVSAIYIVANYPGITGTIGDRMAAMAGILKQIRIRLLTIHFALSSQHFDKLSGLLPRSITYTKQG